MTAARTIELPEVRRLSDLFSGIFVTKADAVPAQFPFTEYGRSARSGRKWERPEKILIGPFVGFAVRRKGGRAGFHVEHGFAFATPTDLCAETVRKTMFAAGVNDAITFDVIDHGDRLLVVAKNSAIIGSRWLAMVDGSERGRLVPFL